jgi:hypothetical protein
MLHYLLKAPSTIRPISRLSAKTIDLPAAQRLAARVKPPGAQMQPRTARRSHPDRPEPSSQTGRHRTWPTRPVQVVRRDLHRRRLEFKQPVAELGRHAELAQHRAGLQRQGYPIFTYTSYGVSGSSRAQLSSMTAINSSESSRHNRSFQRSSNQRASFWQASWSSTSTFNSS